MNLNLTFLGQMIAFAAFVWFCMRYVWPPIIGAINEREQKIQDSLHAAQVAKGEMEKFKKKMDAEKQESRKEATEILAKAKAASDQLVIDAKQKAQEEGDRVRQSTQQDIANQYSAAQSEIKAEIKQVAFALTAHIVSEEFASNVKLNDDLIDRQIAQIKANT